MSDWSYVQQRAQEAIGIIESAVLQALEMASFPDAKDRHRHALLQAAAELYRIDGNVENAVDRAKDLFAEILRTEQPL